jgi:hypothetical protein
MQLAQALSAVSNWILRTFTKRHLSVSLKKMRNQVINVDAPRLLEVKIPFFCEPPTPEESAELEARRPQRIKTAAERG